MKHPHPSAVRLLFIIHHSSFSPGCSLILSSPSAFRSRRVTKTQAAPAPPPPPPPDPATMQSVMQGGDPHAILVSFSTALSGFANLSTAFEVSEDGVSWISPVTFELVTPTQATMIFPVNVSASTVWRIPNPASWAFTDGATLDEPFAGTIAPAAPQIESVQFTENTFEMRVMLSTAVDSIDDLGQALQVSPDGAEWWPATGADLSDPLHLLFDFDGDLPPCTVWRVASASAWNFPDDQHLDAPLSGSIE